MSVFRGCWTMLVYLLYLSLASPTSSSPRYDPDDLLQQKLTVTMDGIQIANEFQLINHDRIANPISLSRKLKLTEVPQYDITGISPIAIRNNDLVKVSFKSSLPVATDWIAAYSADADLKLTVPIKFAMCGSDPFYEHSGSGYLYFNFTNTRNDIMFKYFTGSLEEPVLVAEFSDLVRFENVNEPLRPRVVPVGSNDPVPLISLLHPHPFIHSVHPHDIRSYIRYTHPFIHFIIKLILFLMHPLVHHVKHPFTPPCDVLSYTLEHSPLCHLQDTFKLLWSSAFSSLLTHSPTLSHPSYNTPPLFQDTFKLLWSSAFSSIPTVRWGTQSGVYTTTVYAETQRIDRSHLCGELLLLVLVLLLVLLLLLHAYSLSHTHINTQTCTLYHTSSHIFSLRHPSTHSLTHPPLTPHPLTHPFSKVPLPMPQDGEISA